MEPLYAHTPPPGGGSWHLLEDHLTAVAGMARLFAEPFGAGELAYYLGLWHDVGKSSPAFQAYLQRCYADSSFRGRGTDHKAAGAEIAQRYLQPLALLVQAHHGGLKSSGDFQRWFAERQKDMTPDKTQKAIAAAIAVMRERIPSLEPLGRLPFPSFLQDKRVAEFFLRMLFSTLVDADFLDTEQHRDPDKTVQRATMVGLSELFTRFERNQQQFVGQRDDVVWQARDRMYGACVAAAVQPPGLFRLAMPTGGGKTRSSLAFALHHAARYGQQRIIVAVPFISITEQTVSVLRDIFESDDDDEPVVLEHHSGADAMHSDVDEYQAAQMWQRLAAENWDAPVIVTTTVQLFESLFSHKTSRCRKLHRLAKSIIILDEVQALPTHLLEPILDGVRELCSHYGATVVLSTATQPAFESIPSFSALQAYNIVPDAAQWFSALKRVNYTWQLNQSLAWDEVAEAMYESEQCLVVVNSKPDAIALLDALNDPDVLHLSTLLCGAHRRKVIATVKELLQQGLPCRLVSTQVIEAGVDLDFPRVLRAVGPLDRIIQAAGRCNREGLLTEFGEVVVFYPAEGRMPRGSYATATDLTFTMVGDGKIDMDDPATIHDYFRSLFPLLELDREKVQPMREVWDFPEVSHRFRMIPDDTIDVIVHTYGDEDEQDRVEGLISQLRSIMALQLPGARSVLRKLQPSMVAIARFAAQRYQQQGFIEELAPGLGVWHGKYDRVRGIVADDDREMLVV